MSRRIPNRSKFERFLRNYGVARMAIQLQIDESACYHWLRGVTRPKPEFAATIQRIAREQGSSLTLDDIYGHARKLRAADPSIAINIERRKQACASR
jgi:hypothetical protein